MQLLYNIELFFNKKLSKEILLQTFRNTEQLGFFFITKEAYFNNTDHTIPIEVAVDSIVTQLKDEKKLPINNTTLAAQK